MHKLKNKLIVLLLLFITLFSTYPAVAENNSSQLETTSSLCSEEFYALNAMGLLEDGLVNSSSVSTVNNAEFSANLFKLTGYSKLAFNTQENKFLDVNKNTQYSDEIYTMYKLGIFKGIDSFFHPEQPITYIQALKLLINVLGYSEYTIAQYGDYPGSYLQMANVLDLQKGLDIDEINMQLDADRAVKLLYNAAVTELMETTEIGANRVVRKTTGETLLSRGHNIYYAQGLMQSNGVVSLLNHNVNEDVVTINGVYYQVDDLQFQNLIGCQIKYFYQDEDSYKHLLWATMDSKTSIMTLAYDMLMPDDSQYSMTTIVYDKNGKRATARLDEYADIIYNNALYNDAQIDKLMPKSGTIKLIDNDRDGDYEIIIVEEYSNLFVKTVATDGTFIVGKYNNTLMLDDYDSVKIIKDDILIGINEIGTNVVLSYIENREQESIYIYVNEPARESVLTTLRKENGRTICGFEDGEYRFANSYEILCSQDGYNVTIPEPGVRYRYYLDKGGEIAEVENINDGKLQYALLINAMISDDIFDNGDVAKVRLLLSDGRKITTSTRNRLKLNGVQGENGRDLLNDPRIMSDGVVIPQVVRVAFDSEGLIKEFEVAQEVNSPYGYDNNAFTLDCPEKTSYYDTDSCYLFDYKYSIASETICFVKYTDWDVSEPYDVIPYTGISRGTRTMALYDCDENMKVSALVISMSMKTTYVDGYMLVDEISKVLDDQEEKTKITGLRLGTTASYIEWEQGIVPDDLKRGDIVRVVLFQDKIISLTKVCASNEKPLPFITGSFQNSDSTIWGYIYSVGDRSIVTLDPSGTTPTLTATSFRMGTVVTVSIYDVKRNRIYTGSQNDLYQINTPDINGKLEISEDSVMVFITRRNSYVRDAIVVFY